MPFEVIKKAIEIMPEVRFINAFGQTETASTITTLGPEDHAISGTDAEREKKLKRLSSSIGRPMSDVEMKVIDDEGKACGSLVIDRNWTFAASPVEAHSPAAARSPSGVDEAHENLLLR